MTIGTVKSTTCFGYGDGSTILDQWLEYLHTSVVLICVDAGNYAAQDPGGVVGGVWWSVQDVKERWAKEMFYFFGSGKRSGWSPEKKGAAEEIRAACLKDLNGRRIPFLVVGCQIDSRGNGRGLTSEEVCLFLLFLR